MSGMMTRQDSFGTQGMQSFSATSVNPDVIPLAIAMTENIRARFRGTEHESQVVGDVMMSFSKEYIARENLPSLSFQLAGRSPEQIMVNKEFISSNGDVHTFDTTKLHQHLKSKAAADASVKHVNLQVARYTLTVTCLPLNLVAFWKCEPDTTDFRLDYEYIGSALCKPLPLTNIQFLVPVNGGVNTHNTLPHGVWSPEHRKLLWKIAELKSGSQSKGSVKARFGLADGPSTPGTVDVKFFCDGTILSGTKFELNTKHYKVSYTKHRMVANVAVDTDKLVTYV